ncbi:hypothetical protein ABNG02_13120 [Halorubrum ejinorense]|uniref:Uncharacterized protein n=1 Tax=Halorubrum ejinorense TaxID=425309 RepID=A0ABV4IT38_9EURY
MTVVVRSIRAPRRTDSTTTGGLAPDGDDNGQYTPAASRLVSAGVRPH